MIYNNQFSYDNTVEPELHDYRDEPEFAEFAEYVTLALLAGCDWKNLSSEILMIDLEWDHQMALEWVSERLTENQYLDYLEEFNED